MEMESSSVKVMVRLRPMNEMEKRMGVTPAISASTEHKTITAIKGHGMTRIMYSFDDVYSGFATQKEVFDSSISEVIEDVLKGYTSTILAYGQTGTGKTHTMEGDISSPETYGVIPRSIDHIFKSLQHPNIEDSHVTCSYLEIYNEELRDLFSDDYKVKLEVLNGKDGPICRGLTEKEVSRPEDVLELINKAELSRKIGETKMNKQSSRSHCIFTVHVFSRVESHDGYPIEYHGKLHMVDLAGSENAKSDIGSRTTTIGNARERERMNINRSLLTLGRVISAVKSISGGKKNIRVPYRDSKLTRVLQDALGGRSKTVIIATVSPSDMAIAESLSTLNYAQAANGIVNKPIADSHHLPQHSLDTNGEPNVEKWYELECKLKYMEAQVEEAQVALARKNQQQQFLVDKANKAEEELAKNEEALRNALGRIKGLDNELNDEQKKTATLTNELKLAEASLMRTNAILHATRATEETLRSEARRLIEAVEASISDGDKMHNLLLRENENDAQRKTATKHLHEAVVSVLEGIDLKMQSIVKDEAGFCESVNRASENESKAGQKTLVLTVDALKDINTEVKSVASTIKSLSNMEDGILSMHNAIAEKTSSESTGGIEKVNDMQLHLSSFARSAKESLTRYSELIQSIATKSQANATETISILRSSTEGVKADLADAAEALMKSSDEIASSRLKARNELCKILSCLESRSILTMKNIGASALKQHSHMNQVMNTFRDGMGNLQGARDFLVQQKQFVTAKSSSQLQNISGQSTMLTDQREAFVAAREQQQKMQNEAMRNLITGMQELLENEFSKLNKENDSNLRCFENDTQQIQQMNQTINASAKDIAAEVENTNKSITACVDMLADNDKLLLSSASKTNGILIEIKELAKEQYKFVEESSEAINEKMDIFPVLDETLHKKLEQFERVNENATDRISKTIGNPAEEGLTQISDAVTETVEVATEKVFPEVLGIIEQNKEKCDVSCNNISSHFTSVQDVCANGLRTVTLTVQDQNRILDALPKSINSKCGMFHKNVVAVRRRELDDSCARVAENSSKHLKHMNGSFASTQNLLSEVDNNVADYSENVIHVNEPAAPVYPRVEIPYSKVLPTTPAEHLIVASMDTEHEQTKHPHDENGKLKDPTIKILTSDDGSQPEEACKSPISPLSVMSGNSPDRSSTRNFRF